MAMNRANGNRQSSQQAKVQHVGSYLTDDDMLLARPLPRPDLLEKLSTAWNVAEESTQPQKDVDFNANIAKGLHSRLPERASYVLANRRYGTMCDTSETPPLPESAGAVRLRTEHMQLLQSQSQRERPEIWPVRTRHSVLSIARNAFVREMEDLQRILHSLDVRQYDIRASDIQALFAWFKLVENFLRVYFISTEESVYASVDVERWGNNHGIWNMSERRARKLRIVTLAEDFERVRRPMLALDTTCVKMMPALRRHAERLIKDGLEYFNTEVQVVQCELDKRLTRDEAVGVFNALMKEMQQGVYGKEVVFVMSSGLGVGSIERDAWIRQICQGFTRLVVMLGMHRFKDRHSKFIHLFESACREYRLMYEQLARELDGRIHAVGASRSPRSKR